MIVYDGEYALEARTRRKFPFNQPGKKKIIE